MRRAKVGATSTATHIPRWWFTRQLSYLMVDKNSQWASVKLVVFLEGLKWRPYSHTHYRKTQTCMTWLLGRAWPSPTLTWSTVSLSVYIYIYIYISYVVPYISIWCYKNGCSWWTVPYSLQESIPCISFGSTFQAVLHLQGNRPTSEFSQYLPHPWPRSGSPLDAMHLPSIL